MHTKTIPNLILWVESTPSSSPALSASLQPPYRVWEPSALPSPRSAPLGCRWRLVIKFPSLWRGGVCGFVAPVISSWKACSWGRLVPARLKRWGSDKGLPREPLKILGATVRPWSLGHTHLQRHLGVKFKLGDELGPRLEFLGRWVYVVVKDGSLGGELDRLELLQPPLAELRPVVHELPTQSRSGGEALQSFRRLGRLPWLQAGGQAGEREMLCPTERLLREGCCFPQDQPRRGTAGPGPALSRCVQHRFTPWLSRPGTVHL